MRISGLQCGPSWWSVVSVQPQCTFTVAVRQDLLHSEHTEDNTHMQHGFVSAPIRVSMQQKRHTAVIVWYCINTIDIHILYCKLCILYIEAYSIRRQQEGSSNKVVMLLILANSENTCSYPWHPLLLSCSINRHNLKLIYRNEFPKPTDRSNDGISTLFFSPPYTTFPRKI